MIIERNEQGSRELIMLRLLELRSRGEGWVEANVVLNPCTSEGPWSEDLQNLIREGAVVCLGSSGSAGPNSLVRLP